MLTKFSEKTSLKTKNWASKIGKIYTNPGLQWHTHGRLFDKKIRIILKFYFYFVKIKTMTSHLNVPKLSSFNYFNFLRILPKFYQFCVISIKKIWACQFLTKIRSYFDPPLKKFHNRIDTIKVSYFRNVFFVCSILPTKRTKKLVPQVELFSFVFWKNWRTPKDFSKLTDL